MWYGPRPRGIGMRGNEMECKKWNAKCEMQRSFMFNLSLKFGDHFYTRWKECNGNLKGELEVEWLFLARYFNISLVSRFQFGRKYCAFHVISFLAIIIIQIELLSRCKIDFRELVLGNTILKRDWFIEAWSRTERSFNLLDMPDIT